VWDWAVWGALIVAICSGIAAMVIVFRRTRDAVRSFKSVQSRAVESIRAVEAKAELAAAKAERIDDDTRELQESVARLRGSIAQLAVLRAALAEVDEQWGWVRVFL
jgi:hypothetical protein